MNGKFTNVIVTSALISSNEQRQHIGEKNLEMQKTPKVSGKHYANSVGNPKNPLLAR